MEAIGLNPEGLRRVLSLIDGLYFEIQTITQNVNTRAFEKGFWHDIIGHRSLGPAIAVDRSRSCWNCLRDYSGVQYVPAWNAPSHDPKIWRTMLAMVIPTISSLPAA